MRLRRRRLRFKPHSPNTRRRCCARKIRNVLNEARFARPPRIADLLPTELKRRESVFERRTPLSCGSRKSAAG
jgi:hypothetical protein